ncbi:MAG: TonB-dependent receptor plug domain-containing protein [Deltaproteobacteria bacterium]
MHHARHTLFVAAASVCLAGPAAAQQSDTARIAPVVVTATRVPISAAASPATIDVITGDELRLRGATSIASALQMLPGVTFAQSGSFGSATSLFLRGGESKYVKVLIDGVPVNDPGGAMDFGSLTTDNVERIELVRGPASVLYGADAVTGVIQIFTRRGRGIPRTVISARGGSYGSSDEDGTVLGALGNGDFSLGVARHDTKGIYAFNNAFHNTVASGGTHVQLDPHTDLRVSLRYNDDVLHYPTNGGGVAQDTNAHQTQDRTTLAAELGHAFTPRVDAHLALTSESTSGGTDDKPDTPSSAGFQSLDRTRRRGGDLRTNVALPGSTVITAGIQLEQEDERTESQSVFGTFESTSIFQASRRNTGVYAQALSTLSDALVLTAGARSDDNERFGKFGTYRLGGTWRVIGGTHLRASTGTAFREPSFFENYATGFVTGNKDLKPERSAMSEIGLWQTLLDDAVSIGITQFDQRFRNMIDYTGSTAACGASYCNVARAQANGRELEIRVVPVPRLAVDANLTHLETKVLTPGFDSTSGGLYHAGEALIRRPTTTWNAGAAYVSMHGSFDVRVTRVGRRTDRDFVPFPALPVVDPAYTRTDLGADVPLTIPGSALKAADLTLHVENLFDATYQSVYGFLSPRRTVLAGARVTF